MMNQPLGFNMGMPQYNEQQLNQLGMGLNGEMNMPVFNPNYMQHVDPSFGFSAMGAQPIAIDESLQERKRTISSDDDSGVKKVKQDGNLTPSNSEQMKYAFSLPDEVRSVVQRDIMKYNELVEQKKKDSLNRVPQFASNIAKPRPRDLKAKSTIPTGAFAPGNFKKKEKVLVDSIPVKDDPLNIPIDSSSVGNNDARYRQAFSNTELIKDDDSFAKILETLSEDLSKSSTGSTDLKLLLITAVRVFNSKEHQEKLMNRLTLTITCFEKDTWGKDPDWRFVCLNHIVQLSEFTGVTKRLINFNVKFGKKNKLFNRISNWIRFDFSNKNFTGLAFTLKFLKSVGLSYTSLEAYKFVTPLVRLQSVEDRPEVAGLAKEIIEIGEKKKQEKADTLSKSSVKLALKPSAKSPILNKGPLVNKQTSNIIKTLTSKPASASTKTSSLFKAGGAAKKPDVLPAAATVASLRKGNVSAVKKKVTHTHSASTFGQNEPAKISTGFARFLPKPVDSPQVETSSEEGHSIVEVDEPANVDNNGIKSILRRKNDTAPTKRKRRKVQLNWEREDKLAAIRYFDFDPEERKLNLLAKDNPLIDKYEHAKSEDENNDQPEEIDDGIREIDESRPWTEPLVIDFTDISWHEYSKDNASTRANGEVPIESAELIREQQRQEKIPEVLIDDHTVGIELADPPAGGLDGEKPDSSNGLVLQPKSMVSFGTVAL